MSLASAPTRDDRLAWMRQGTKHLLRIIDGLAPETFTEASRLPAWTVGHVVAHLHFNGLALGRLVSWAATGVRTPMYGGPDQRAAEIESGARMPADELKTLLRESSIELDKGLSELSADQWSAGVVTAQGRDVTAEEIPWMRVREVAVHAIDLGGSPFHGAPEGLVDVLVHEVVDRRLSRGEGPLLAAILTGRAPADEPLPAWL